MRETGRESERERERQREKRETEREERGDRQRGRKTDWQTDRQRVDCKRKVREKETRNLIFYKEEVKRFGKPKRNISKPL